MMGKLIEESQDVGVERIHYSGLRCRVSVTAMDASTAMRTATPLLTCSRMTERGPSATSEAISTPRFMGPGCMTSTLGEASFTRFASKPKSDRKSTRLNSSHLVISYAVFCLKKKKFIDSLPSPSKATMTSARED